MSDYLYGTAPPNVIHFSISVANNYVNTPAAPAQLNITGIPYKIAFSLDDPNYADDAVWYNFASANITIPLGSTEGWHDVWVGLKGYGSDPSVAWVRKRLKLDQTPPWLVVTNPVSDVVSQPMIELKGYCAEPLAHISYDLNNAAGLVTDQQVLVLSQFYDTEVLAFTTNNFQAFDVPLATGLNVITLDATDLAGNEMITNFSCTVDYSNDTAPEVQIYWPQDGAKICGSTFTLRGWISDFTATITAQTVDTDGTTLISNGVVERDGDFWIENLPVGSSGRDWTLTATDAAGQVTQTNITVSAGDAGLAVNPIADPNELWNPTITVQGTIANTTDYSVWVNGMKATIHTDGSWEADNVPLPPGGTAVIQARAIPNSDNGGDGSGGSGGGPVSYDNPGNPDSPEAQDGEVQPDKPAGLYLARYTMTSSGKLHEYDEACNPDTGSWVDDVSTNLHSVVWTSGLPGEEHDREHNEETSNPEWRGMYTNDDLVNIYWQKSTYPTLDVSLWQELRSEGPNVNWQTYWTDGNFTMDAPVFREHCSEGVSQTSTVLWPWLFFSDPDSGATITTTINAQRTADAVMRLRTGGKAVPGRRNLWRLSCSADKILAPLATPPFDETPTEPIPAQDITILGKALGSDGNLWIALPDGTNIDVTPKISGVDYYFFREEAQKYASHFEVFVHQPWSELSYQPWLLLDPPEAPPLGWPLVRGLDDAGHAWWELRTEAPTAAINQFISANSSYWLGYGEVGYGPATSLSWDPNDLVSVEAPGELPYPYSKAPTVDRIYRIGFSGLIAALNHTEHVHENPGIWDSRYHNCVHETRITGSAAGLTMPNDWIPEWFGFDLPPTNP